MVGLKSTCARNVVVRADGGGGLGNVRCNCLIILVLGQLLVDGQLRLDVLLPLCLAIRLGLLETRGAVLGGISLGRDEDPLVGDVVVGGSLLDVGGGIGIIIGLDMR